MNSNFEIRTQSYRRLLRLKLLGFWSMDDFVALQTALESETAKVRVGGLPHLMLVDLTDFKIQTQAVLAACQELIGSGANPPEKLALVGGEGLARMQFRRAIVRENMAMFENSSDAEAWLFDRSPAR